MEENNADSDYGLLKPDNIIGIKKPEIGKKIKYSQIAPHATVTIKVKQAESQFVVPTKAIPNTECSEREGLVLCI